MDIDNRLILNLFIKNINTIIMGYRVLKEKDNITEIIIDIIFKIIFFLLRIINIKLNESKYIPTISLQNRLEIKVRGNKELSKKT